MTFVTEHGQRVVAVQWLGPIRSGTRTYPARSWIVWVAGVAPEIYLNGQFQILFRPWAIGIDGG